jgi:hypothetical protein
MSLTKSQSSCASIVHAETSFTAKAPMQVITHIWKPKPGVALSSQGCQLVLIIARHGVDRAKQVWSAAEVSNNVAAHGVN